MQSSRAIVSFVLLIALGHAGAVATDTADLDWLAGHWCLQEDDGSRTEEVWLPAAGGMLLGVSRSWRGEALRSFEFLRIAQVDGVATYLAQPGGKSPITFARADGGADWVRFENLAHDFPQQIEYRRSGAALDAQISGPDGKGGTMVVPFAYQGCTPEG